MRVEYHPNGCYDWGTIGWLLDSGKVDTRPYKYFIFMNSSVRGPFLPVFNKVRLLHITLVGCCLCMCYVIACAYRVILHGVLACKQSLRVNLSMPSRG